MNNDDRLATPHTSPESSKPSYIVGIGASAGGLEALERMFRTMPSDTGMAYVVVQHLSPDFESMMDELLDRQTSIPIHTVEDGITVESDAIYLIPPRKEMIISDGRLLLTDKDPRDGLSLPIDQFFRSLARDAEGRSIGIILSGTGSDGSRGIREIHDTGGLVIVQSEETARFDGMPRSAMETGAVDLILAPEEIGPTLARFANNPVVHELPAGDELPPVDEDAMNHLLRLLRDAHSIDFSYYKPSTVRRRIERRLLMSRLDDFDQYVDQVAENPDELNSLYRDLLIGVTQFFRDRDAFQVLESQIIPEFLSSHSPDEELRIWTAGCATGEEAYSLGILVQECMSRMSRPLDVKIFATDVHQSSLDFASAGIYSEASLTDVSPERLERFFVRKGQQYQVVPSLRKMVVFAQHNIIKDAPFTRLDLISCRNLLIYLQPSVQKKAISLFHFGLRTGGVLFLGPSEGVAELESEFTSLDRHWKMYRKRRDVRLPADMRLPLSSPVSSPRILRPIGEGYDSRPDSELLDLYDRILEEIVPAAVLVDENHQIRHVFGNADQYLKVRRGRPSHDLLNLLESELRTAVAGAMQRALKEDDPIAYTGIRVETSEGPREVRLTVTPLRVRRLDSTYLLVGFDAVIPSGSPDEEIATVDIGEVSRERTEALESELRRTKENLQATIEELEASNEELHATNEELVASNEELQSTNEELHSVNEELYTVNAEYQRKISELTELTDDIEHLLDSTDVGTVYLDRKLCIRKITPRISQIFSIVSQDVGRRFDSFTHSIEHPGLMNDVQSVLQTGRRIEREVQDRLGHWFYLRILPYRSHGEIDGVVLTLIDTQALHSAKTELREKDRQLQSILDNAPAFIFIRDNSGRYSLVNDESRGWFGHEANRVIGHTDHDFLPQRIADRLQAFEREVIASGEPYEFELGMPGRNGDDERTWLTVMFPLRDDAGRISSVAGIANDISDRKAAEKRVRESLRQRDQFLAMLSHELRNPLGALQNGLRLLRHDTIDETTRERTQCMLERQSSQMAHLLDDLLDVSRIEQGRVELRRTVLDLRATAEAAVESLRDRFRSAEIDLDVYLPDEPVLVKGDETRLQQIQVNLLVNAVKYTAAGGCVDLTVSTSDGQAVITIRDTGVGMTSTLLTKIFEPFVQADETLDRADGGIGVGLSLTKSLVELHHGTITAHSDGPGRGSEFVVQIPLSKEANLEGEHGEYMSPVDSTHLKLFLVEDNDDARNTLKLLLELEGFQVGTAADGRSAVDAIKSEQPDVAIVDVGLPEIDGFEVARRLRETLPPDKLCLVALTGYGQPKDRLMALEAGFDEHLTKPVDTPKLFKLLESRVMRERKKTSRPAAE